MYMHLHKYIYEYLKASYNYLFSYINVISVFITDWTRFLKFKKPYGILCTLKYIKDHVQQCLFEEKPESSSEGGEKWVSTSTSCI